MSEERRRQRTHGRPAATAVCRPKGPVVASPRCGSPCRARGRSPTELARRRADRASLDRGAQRDHRHPAERQARSIRSRVLGRGHDQAKPERPVLVLHDVTKRYPNGKLALRDVDLVIPEGDFVFLVGPSGAGKSTLIKLLIRDELADPRRGRPRRPGPGPSAAPPGPPDPSQDRDRLPGLQAAADQDGLGERGVRARGDRHVATPDPAGGRSRAGPGRPDGTGGAGPVAALGRRAAAHRDRPRAGPRPAADHRRRANRQPRPADQLGDPPAPASDQRAGRDRDDGDPQRRGRHRASQARASRSRRVGSSATRSVAPTTARTERCSRSSSSASPVPGRASGATP